MDQNSEIAPAEPISGTQLSDLIREHGRTGAAKKLGIDLNELERLCNLYSIQESSEKGSWAWWIGAFVAAILAYQAVTQICLYIIPYPTGLLVELLLGPFVFVYTGARISPSNRYYVSVSLAVVILLVYTWLPSNLPVPNGRERLQFLLPSFAGVVAALHLIRWQFPSKRLP